MSKTEIVGRIAGRRVRLPVSTTEARRLRGLVKDERMSEVAQAKRRNKYGNKGCWLDLATGRGADPKAAGARYFASQAEGTRYQQLLTLRQLGLIERLELQGDLPLAVNGMHICNYRFDFRYWVLDERGRPHYQVIEDVKGMVLDVYDLKKKMVRAIHGIAITEIPANEVNQWTTKLPPPP